MYSSFKLLIALASAATVSAVLTASAVAVDPQAENCQGLGPGVRDIDLQVVPNTAGSVSSFTGGVLLCGSDLGPSPKGFKSGEIELPWAVGGNYRDGYQSIKLIQPRCANPKFYRTEGEASGLNCPVNTGPYSLEEGQYIGSVGMGISTGGGEIALDGAVSKIYVQKAPGTPIGNTHCTIDAVVCYQGTDGALGYADMTIVRDTSGAVDTYKLNIHEIVLMVPLPVEVYYTRIGYPEDGKPLDLCRYAGDVNGSSCGASGSSDWVQKNGPAERATCNVIDWMNNWSFGGGVGFVISTDNNVPGADDWWANHISDFSDRDEVIAALRESGGQVPHCAPLTLVNGGTKSVGGPTNSSQKDPAASKSDAVEKLISTSDTKSTKKGSNHQLSRHVRFE